MRLTVGAFIIRVGFWGFLIIMIVNIPRKPILIVKAPAMLHSPFCSVLKRSRDPMSRARKVWFPGFLNSGN